MKTVQKKADENYTEEVDENCTKKADENCTGKVLKKNIG